MNNFNNSDILNELGLIEDYNEQLKSFKKMKTVFSFAWVNLANKSLKIKKLFDFIKNNNYVFPPRTGHIGNWNDIIDGYINYRNDNTIICSQEKIGYPLIFDLTQTEDIAMQKGDLTYLPGSIINKGSREILQCFTWKGNCFEESFRENPLFVPFVLTKIDNKFVPLIKVHRDRYEKYNDINFIMFSDVVYKYKKFIKKILIGLIEDIMKEENPEHELKFIIDRVVKVNGEVIRDTLRVDNNYYYVGEEKYDDISSLVDTIIYPYMAVAESERFFSNIKDIPNYMPLLSNHISVILTCILYTHMPDYLKNNDKINTLYKCNVHMQWGGIAMAGYPPRELGYFHREIRYVRTIYRRILKLFNELSPIYFILLPSSIFLLWPNDCNPNDVTLIGKLICEVNKEEELLSHLSKKELYKEINKIVDKWIKKVNGELSELFKNRFMSSKPEIFSEDRVVKNVFLKPKGFDDLTIQQASMIVSSLFEYFSKKE